jgi:hypothetical protein
VESLLSEQAQYRGRKATISSATFFMGPKLSYDEEKKGGKGGKTELPGLEVKR